MKFSKFGFHGCFKVRFTDTTQILIYLRHDKDFSMLFLKPFWYIDKCRMRVLKGHVILDLSRAFDNFHVGIILSAFGTFACQNFPFLLYLGK